MRSRLCNFALCFSLLGIRLTTGLASCACAQGRYGGHTFSSFEPPTYSSPSDAIASDLYQSRQQFFGASPTPAEAYVTSSPMPQFPQQTSPFPSGLLRLNSPMTRPLLDFVNRQSEKELFLMSKEAVACNGPEITIGAQFRASAMVGHTNTANKFPYQGRFPGDFVGTR